MHPLPAEPACLLQSPVLIMLASADGLTGAALSAAEALRPALDERLARLDRLDALDRCLDWLPVVMPEPRALERLSHELLRAVAPALQGPGTANSSSGRLLFRSVSRGATCAPEPGTPATPSD